MLIATIIQSALFWEDKRANLEQFEQKINTLTTKTNLVILPEMFTTGFSMRTEDLAETMDGPTVTWMKKMAIEHSIILTGSIIIKDNQQYFNRLIWMLPNGRFGYYDKRHLFAFAGEEKYYTPGNKRLITSVNGFKIQLLVCYDLRFPVWTRQANQANPEYDILIVVANWPASRSHAWKTLLAARAIENQCYVIGVNRIGEDGHNSYLSGDSTIIDPLGNILFTQADEPMVHTIKLKKENLNEIRNKFPFGKDADAFQIIQ
jgi:predicted amidohydrolase